MARLSNQTAKAIREKFCDFCAVCRGKTKIMYYEKVDQAGPKDETNLVYVCSYCYTKYKNNIHRNIVYQLAFNGVSKYGEI